MREQVLTKSMAGIARQLARQVVHRHDGDSPFRIECHNRFRVGVVAVERVGNGARAQRAGHRAVDVAADIGHHFDAPVRAFHVVTGEEVRRSFPPIVARDVHVRHLGVGKEGAFEVGGVRDERFHVKGPSILVCVVPLNIQPTENGLVEGLAEEGFGMDFSESEGGEQFMRPHAHASSARQDELEVGRQVHGFGMCCHLLQMGTIDGFGQMKAVLAHAPSPKGVVGSHDACPAPKPNDAAPVGALDQLVVDETNALVHHGFEQGGIVGLEFVRVAEEQVGRV